MAMTLEQEREAFEKWYVENAFDYEANPLGSRDCGLQWKAWQAARTTQPAPLITDEAVERLAQHIYEQEARNRCKTIDEAVFHRSKWRRAIPEARAMLEATFPAHLTQPAQAVDASDLDVLRRLKDALPTVGLNGWVHGVAALDTAIRALAGEQAGWRVPVTQEYTTGHCENHKAPGGCQLHNLQCGWPKCDRQLAKGNKDA